MILFSEAKARVPEERPEINPTSNQLLLSQRMHGR